MSKLKNLNDKYFRVAFFVVFLVVILFLIIRYFNQFGNVLLVMLGFGTVILVHEFGHFIVAKLSNIKVEAFSIFMPPILFGVKRTEKGIRFRILPEIFPKEGDESGEGAINFTVGKEGQAGETEYRIGLIPFGGFVKMLGQDDIGPVKNSDDPRSYANKPVYIRAATIAAGVVFNIISAVIIFMIVFLIGIDLMPPIVGGVIPDSPAALAGLKAGDEIIEIAGKKEDLDFSNIGIAAALSGKDEKITLKVRHPDDPDGTAEEVLLVAKELTDEPLRKFGILPAMDLTVAKPKKNEDTNDLFAKTGLMPGDRIISVDGRDLRGHWELVDIIQNTFAPEVKLSVERNGNDGKSELIETRIRLIFGPSNDNKMDSDSDLSNIYSMVPRLKITGLSEKLNMADGNTNKPLRIGDIILAVADINNPTLKELRDTVTMYENKELPLTVLRTDTTGLEKSLKVFVTPERSEESGPVQIGIELLLDMGHPVIAKTITYDGGPKKLEIPSGASITAVDGEPVSSFFDIIREIKKYSNERITVNWRLDEETAGSVALDLSNSENFINIQPSSYDFDTIPFEILQVTYRANGPIDAVVMGYRRTVMFIAQTYVTLKRLVGGLVSPKNLMGPVGIIKASYDIVSEEPIVTYIYFLGLISAVIAVFNFLPLPPLDGGLVVLLLVEKLKGSALSERIQTIIAYTGWALILLLFLYVTFNDIVRSFFSPGLGT
ncbi:MAG: site-2 protease family protein [Sedimentisphaerales bacterium]|nr:site-2 protease family protein [Sedimentisphaerales bacterium]